MDNKPPSRSNQGIIDVTHSAVICTDVNYWLPGSGHDYFAPPSARQNYLFAPIGVRDEDRIISVRIRMSMPQDFQTDNIHTYVDPDFHYIVVYNISPSGEFYTVPTVITIPKYAASGIIAIHIQEPLIPLCACCAPTVIQFDHLNFSAHPGEDHKLLSSETWYARI